MTVKACTKAFIDALGKCLSGLRIARRDRIAMHGFRRHVRQDVNGRFLDVFRCGHIRIAQAEIKDILLADLGSPLAAELEDCTDGRFFRPQFIHRFRYHKYYHLYAD